MKYSFIIGVNAGAGKVANAVADFSQTVVNGKGYGTVELTKYNTAETKTLQEHSLHCTTPMENRLQSVEMRMEITLIP